MLKVLLLLLPLTLLAQEPQYEMTNYVVGFLSRGPKWSAELTDESKKLQEGHMKNIQRMADLKKLIVAGPFRGNDDLRGILIFQEGVTLDEAKELVAPDPAVKAGRLDLKLMTWFAAKGLKINPPK